MAVAKKPLQTVASAAKDGEAAPEKLRRLSDSDRLIVTFIWPYWPLTFAKSHGSKKQAFPRPN